MDDSTGPIFTAVSSSARQLFLLLRCIGFSPKATVQITAEGIRFSVEDARAIQGLAFLDKHLFTSFTFNPPPVDATQESTSSDDTGSTPIFQISLSAFLETLQIFGISDPTASTHPYSHPTSTSNTTAFNAPALSLGGTCTLTYAHMGAPLSITLTESGVTTICDLTTYEPDAYSHDETIPLQRNALTLKIIMRSAYLADAISELSSTNPNVLALSASSSTPPYFALESSGGPFGDSIVEFSPLDSTSNHKSPSATTNGVVIPAVTETFSVVSSTTRIRQRYSFNLIRKAAKAMALASKVSIRGDVQGVLSLQFMIEVGDGGSIGGPGRDGVGGRMVANGSGTIGTGSGGAIGSGPGGGKASFVDFRFVPLLDEDDADEE